MVLGGAGHHIGNLQAIQILRFRRSVLALQIFYALILGCAKMSITWLLKRIFYAWQSIVIAAYIIIILTIGWMIQTILTGVLICSDPITPNRQMWELDHGFLGSEHCRHCHGYTDTPPTAPGGLKLSTRTSYKLALCGLFSMGLLYGFNLFRIYFSLLFFRPCLAGLRLTKLTFSFGL